MQITDEMVEAAAAQMMQYGVNARESTIYAAACSALTAALAAMWRPISEAPKLPEPGQYSPPIVRLWDGTRERHGYWNDDRYKKEPRPYWRYSDSNAVTNDRANQPTHFMPLSSPPNISARSSAGSEQPPSKRQVAGSNPAERASSSPQKMEG